MDMRYLSIYLWLLSFLSFVFYSVSVQVFHLVKFTPKYFIPFYATIDLIVFLILFSDSLLLVSRNTNNFYVLILYPATLLNQYISHMSVQTHAVFRIFYI